MLPDEAEIKFRQIGVIDNGIDGRDEYLILTRLDDDMTPEILPQSEVDKSIPTQSRRYKSPKIGAKCREDKEYTGST